MSYKSSYMCMIKVRGLIGIKDRVWIRVRGCMTHDLLTHLHQKHIAHNICFCLHLIDSSTVTSRVDKDQ